MDWFRAHHGISNDIKIALIAAKLNVPRCEIGWVWMICLDRASQNTDDRGNIDGLLTEEIAMLAGIASDRASEIMQAFHDRGMIEPDGRLTSWDKRQPSTEDRTAADRQRRFRSKKSVTPVSNGVTNDRNAVTTVTNGVVTTEQNRTEHNRAEQNSSLFSVLDFFEERYAEHPKKGHRSSAEMRMSEIADITSEEFRENFRKVHRAMIASDDWKWKNGAKAPYFDEWIVDKGYNYPPAEHVKPSAATVDPVVAAVLKRREEMARDGIR